VTPSGLDVPRYVSLKYETVNARNGPDEAHRLLWVYRAKGLPVQVVAETREWRRICDPGRRPGLGAQAHHRRPPHGHARPAHAAGPAGQPQGRVQDQRLAARPLDANLDKCEKGWCRLKAEGSRGWARESEIWGAAPKVQCKS
jgi:SH3-like domain-containing protein